MIEKEKRWEDVWIRKIEEGEKERESIKRRKEEKIVEEVIDENSRKLKNRKRIIGKSGKKWKSEKEMRNSEKERSLIGWEIWIEMDEMMVISRIRKMVYNIMSELKKLGEKNLSEYGLEKMVKSDRVFN